jgi:kinesin family protein C2/C3
VSSSLTSSNNIRKQDSTNITVLRKLANNVRSIKQDLLSTKQDTLNTFVLFGQDLTKAHQTILKRMQTYYGSDLVLNQQIEFIQEKYRKELALRKKLQNELIEERGNIRVFCRIRPFIDTDQSHDTNLQVTDDNTLVVKTRGGVKTRQFELDHVFPMNATQADIFDHVKPLLSSVLDGYNLCILAYGQTGSGKTYTMEGTVQEQGVIPRALAELFERMHDSRQTHQFQLTMSMVEVYNNEVRDLLRNDKRTLDVFDSETGLQVKGATTKQIDNMEQVTKYIRKGSWNRSEASTFMNIHSSRSHSIVTIQVETHQTQHSKTIMGFNMAKTKAKLRLVDLAGSECLAMSGVTGDQAKETSYVNRSLAALGDVMAALSQQKGHVPYRNSRLTHLLQDSLGGDAKMLVLVCVSPTIQCATETAHAISFGSRTRLVMLKKRNH